MDDIANHEVELDVENLFNDENLNNAALEASDLPENAILDDPGFGAVPAQSSHIVDLAVNGALNTLAWAKSGLIARVSESGTEVTVSVQRFDARSGKWTVTEPQPLNATFNDAFVIAWNSRNDELAVFDRKGGLDIFTTPHNAHNILVRSRDRSQGAEDEANEPIGVLWMVMARSEKDKKKTVLENVKENGRWRHEHIEGGYYPPYLLRAICYINRSGVLTMLWTRDLTPMKLSVLPLPTRATTDTFTHAAMCQTADGKILVALHEATSGHISTYIVSMTFDSTTQAPILTADVITYHVAATPPYCVADNRNMTDLLHGSVLTHLHIVPESEYSWDHLTKEHLKPKQPAMLIAVYSAYDPHQNAAAGNAFGSSIIKRWYFQSVAFQLHPRFGAGQNNSTTNALTMHSLTDATTSAPITKLQVIEPGNLIITMSTDGSTALFDPFTMRVPVQSTPPLVISSLASMNVDYARLERSVTQVLSNHALCMAHISQSGKLEIAVPKYRDLSESTGAQDKLHDLVPSNPVDEALIAGYILSFSRSCWNAPTTFDDISASISLSISAASLVHIRRQLFTSLFKVQQVVAGPPNVSEVEKIPQSAIHHKALAFQFNLFRLKEHCPPEERTSFLWTWMALNFRWSINTLGEAYKTMSPPNLSQPQRQPNQFPPTYLDMVCNNIRWIFSVYNFIFQSILRLNDRKMRPDWFSDEPDSVAGDGKQGLLALLLTQTWSRAHLTIIGRLIKTIASKSGLLINFNESKPLQTDIPPSLAGTTLGRVANTVKLYSLKHGITVNAIEALTNAAYHPDKWGSDSENQEIFKKQIDMISTGKVLPEYEGVVQKIHDACISGPDGLRTKGELDGLRLMESDPEIGYVLLNMDDVVFANHRPELCIDAFSLKNGAVPYATDKINETGNKHKPPRVLYNVHKKLPLFSRQSLQINPSVTPNSIQIVSNEALLAAKARRCVRCGSLSDDFIDGPMQPAWPRQVLPHTSQCPCDGGWIVETVGEGLCL